MVYEENVTRHTDRPLFWKTPSTKTTQYAMSKVVFGQPILSPRPLLYLILPPSVVGNVPYNMGEARSHYQSFPRPPRSPHLAQDQLIDVFKSVGQVVGFRCVSDQSLRALAASLTVDSLVFDRETGKPKGYGFCEFAGTFYVPPSSCQSILSLSDSYPPD